jgi:hypothetical protein
LSSYLLLITYDDFYINSCIANGGIFRLPNYIRSKKRLKDVNMAVNYRFQDHPGQYSGSLSSNHGMLVFRATRLGHHASSIVIRDVKIRDRRIIAKLQQNIVMPFREGEEVSAAASLRFRIISGEHNRIGLQDRKVNVVGVVNYSDGTRRPYRTVLLIGDVYQGDSAII